MVTHSAVSQAIRRLEEDLGAKLFDRRGSFMEPAPSTLVLARAYHGAAQRLSRSLVDIAGRNTPDKLVVALPPGLARLWLSPRLPRLSAAFPGVSCDLRTTRDLASLDGYGVDLAIRFGHGPWPPCRAVPLFDLNLFPVASLALARNHPEVTPALIASLPLIDQPEHPWETWFAPSGVAVPATGGRDTFDDEQMALDMAAAGMGLALTYAQAAEPYLADGRLVRFGDLAVPTERRAWLVLREDNPKLRLVRNFPWWLRDELGSSGGQHAGTAAWTGFS